MATSDKGLQAAEETAALARPIIDPDNPPQNMGLKFVDGRMVLFDKDTGEITAYGPLRTLETVEQEVGLSLSGTTHLRDIVGKRIILFGEYTSLQSAFPAPEGVAPEDNVFSLWSFAEMPKPGQNMVHSLLVCGGVFRNQARLLESMANGPTICVVRQKNSTQTAGYSYFAIDRAELTPDEMAAYAIEGA